ncbi:MAG: class I SAM-dependent methyltransferase [Gammaproteobacteria bacterium]|nr:class I SAM-dependent methyltransferase [Gammaproteobacteria bacterium]
MKTISLRAPLPTLGTYTIGNDFATIMIDEILTRKPKVILEAGSGVSTILAAYCMEKLGTGTLRSLEHLPEYQTATSEMLSEHHLEKTDTKIILAPLREYTFHAESYHWYTTQDLDILTSIDMLIVDGPPRPTCHLARYSILPLFYERLSPQAIILLDDTHREDEKIITERWLKEFPEFKAHYFSTQKGAILFHK